MLSKFFIQRPIFAGVLAIIVMAVGLFAVLNLPVERYPDIAPPRITVSASYSGASAETVEESVTQVLEQQIKGIDNLLYFSSSSDSSGRSRISISFENGTDPDTAQVQIQNSINGVINRVLDLNLCCIRISTIFKTDTDSTTPRGITARTKVQ